LVMVGGGGEGLGPCAVPLANPLSPAPSGEGEGFVSDCIVCINLRAALASPMATDLADSTRRQGAIVALIVGTTHVTLLLAAKYGIAAVAQKLCAVCRGAFEEVDRLRSEKGPRS
jgi:hypothetical protein